MGIGAFPRTRRGTRHASLCVLILVLVPGLALAFHAPSRLIDGSLPPKVPKVLQGQVGSLRMTRVRVGLVSRMRAAMPGCPEAREARPGEPAVERIGFTGRSVTFRVDRSTIAGCDRDPRAESPWGPWCGIAAWKFEHGRVSDARLAICYRKRGIPHSAFAWINTLARARWVVVDQPGYREVYAVAGNLPVRIATVSGIGQRGVTTFRVAQYDAKGVLLVRKEVVAAVAS